MEIGGDTEGTGNEDIPEVTGTLEVSDPADGVEDGTIFDIKPEDEPEHGTATVDPETGEWTYTPEPDFHGEDEFTITVTDDEGHEAEVPITVTIESVGNKQFIESC